MNVERASERITERSPRGPESRRGLAHAASSPSRSSHARSATYSATTRRTSDSRGTVWKDLFEQGRIDYRPVFPGRAGFGAGMIETEADIEDVIALMRLNYERVVGRHGLPTVTGRRP
jgi:hypothetical protein